MPGVTRRTFMAGAAGALAAPWVFAEERPMPTRTLGRTGVKVSLAGLGCVQIGRRGMPEPDAVAIVRRALELGINYIDTAQQYGQGLSEKRVGLALKGGLRDKVFLATKTLQRGSAGAERDLDGSLERLQTDHVDLWQFHALRSDGDTQRILDGAVKAGERAIKAGKARFLGITGHYDPQVFVNALKRYDFSTLLIPLNCIDPHHRSFEKTALPFANEKKTGVIAMKVYCSGNLPRYVKAEDCLRYTYGLPISTCIVGCSSVAEIELAAHVARNLEKMSDKEREDARAKTKAHSPGLEWYKR
jgi:aryl-alcohol dehydrogenase-like predicted oxidoreductase